MLVFNEYGRLVDIKPCRITDGKEKLEVLKKIDLFLTILKSDYRVRIERKLSEILRDVCGENTTLGDAYHEFIEYRRTHPPIVVDGKIKTTRPKDVFYCDYCREFHSFEHTTATKLDDGNTVCAQALVCGVNVCAVCGKRFLGTIMYNNMCRDCHQKEQKYNIKRYHDNPTLEFYDENGQTANTNGEFYGIELEVDRGGERNDMSKDVIKLMQDRVYTMHDGSLSNGFEIITHPHTEKAIKNLNWKDTFKWLIHKGYRSHDMNTCGLHVHINRSVFKDDASIIKMMYFYDKYFDEVRKVSRRDRNRASRWAGKYYYSDDVVTLSKCRSIYYDINANSDHDLRYKCVNLQKSNTVEIRIMRGTLNYDTFMASLDFIMTVAKNSNKVTDVDDWSQWLDGIEDNTKAYLCARNAFGYPPEERTIVDDCYNMTNEEIRNMEEIVCAL